MKSAKHFAAIVVTAATLGAGGPALAHEGGHQGGCDEFGHINLYYSELIRQNPSLGFRNLGDAISGFAHDGTGRGVADVVESEDHALCE